MVSTPAKDDGTLEPAPVTAGGTYKIQTISVGCKLYARRWNPDTNEIEERQVEILSIRDKPPANPYLRRQLAGAAGPSSSPAPAFAPDPELDRLEFFVHWDQFNKRLDEWLPGSRLVLSRDLEWPRPKKEKKDGRSAGGSGRGHTAASPSPAPSNRRVGKMPRGKENNQSLLRRATTNAALTGQGAGKGKGKGSAPPSAPPTPTPAKRTLKRKQPVDEEEEEDEDAEGSPDVEEQDRMDIDGEGDDDADGETDGGEGETFDITDAVNATEPVPAPQPLANYSKEEEIEKLRTGGSMTQSVSEVARVKNLNRLAIGKHEVDSWYFSPYPQEYAHLPMLYLCEFCFAYFPSHFMLGRHRQRCTLLCPPGNEIYREGDISFFEIDGRKQLTYCRNLSLLSKCFLDHKTLYYDVTPFMYYVMTQRDSHGAHLVGYFSKEKECAEQYNVACILTLPQHQRHGYGKLLIEFSYLLSQREGKLGSPEKPLSDLGLLGYRSYWAEKIVEAVVTAGEEVSVDEIAQATSITHADVMNTCTTLQLFKHYKGQHVIALSDSVLDRYEKAKNKRRRRIDKDCLKWKPPTFTRDQLRFGW
ncbi:hypothetical protein PENSPDRAFT_601585 [Peniophora sp. CONT]|nr:hypothetical protein PENSPDRAFT_601585 [Peniophora sp. CONT]